MNLLKWVTKRSYFLWKKWFISKRQRLLKLMIFIRFPASKSTKSAVTGWQNTTNPGLKMFGYNVLINEIWQKRKLKMGPTFGYLLNTIRPGIEKMWFFNWEYLSYHRSLWNFLICFLFVSQFYVDRAYQPIF